MLDELLNLVINQLDLDQSTVDAWIEEIGSEVAIDNVGQTRRRQLLSLLRSGRPVDAQIDSFEKTYWKMEEEAAPKLKEAIVPLLALALQRRKIEALKAKRLEQRDMTAVPQAGNVHEDFEHFCLGLERLGGSHTKVAQFAEPERAIIADLARWKAEDPRFERSDNPWVDVRAVYASRTMEQRQEGQRVRSMSTPGAPPRERPELGSTRYWRFEPGKHVPSWQRTTQPTVIRYVELPAGLALDANGQIVNQPAIDSLPAARPPIVDGESQSSPGAETATPLPTGTGEQPSTSARPSTPSAASPWNVVKPVPLKFDRPLATSNAASVNPPPAKEPKVGPDATPVPSVAPTSAGEPEKSPLPAASAMLEHGSMAAPSEQRTAPIDYPVEAAPAMYLDIARQIIEAKFESLWQAIGLEARPTSVRFLERNVDTAAATGITHEYLDEVRRFSDFRVDTSFIEEIVERDTARLAATLSKDAAMRESMRTAGFNVPLPHR